MSLGSMRRGWRAWALVALVGAVLMPQAAAQSDPLKTSLRIEPESNPLRCLAVGATLAYPPGALELKRAGTVRVKLAFAAADKAPTAEVFYVSGGDEFSRAVKEHVASYRLPCLQAAEAPINATQEFVFTPGDGRPVQWSPVRGDFESLGSLADCLKGGLPRRPDYPLRARTRGDQGVVVALLRFTSPTDPPLVDIVYNARSPSLEHEVRNYLSDYRLPCMPPGSPTLIGRQNFEFSLTGDSEPTYRLKDISLMTMLRGLDDLDRHKVRFDFDSMACPFDVKVVLLQPYMPNRVGEVGEANANRCEFVEWLTTVSLKLPKSAERSVIGDTMTVAVPCGSLDLR